MDTQTEHKRPSRARLVAVDLTLLDPIALQQFALDAQAALAQQAPTDGATLEQIARRLDDGAPGIVYRQDLAAILRECAAPQPVQGEAVELCGVRDTLIVAANNPVSHGGIGGLREVMLKQAHRITAALAQQANEGQS